MEEKRTESEIRAAVEAILFAAGDSVENERLAEALDLDKQEMIDILKRMALRYEEADRGIRLVELDGSWQLCTKTEHYEELIRVVKQPKKTVLTDVLLETLSIVAYKQPVTRLEVEKIRGVKSDHAVNKLVEYGLIRRWAVWTRRDVPFSLARRRNFCAGSGSIPWEICPGRRRSRWRISKKRRKRKQA